MNNLSKNLLFLRKDKKLTQAKIQELIGISRVTWSNWENGNTQPDIVSLVNISDMFSVNIDDLIKIDLKENMHLIGKAGKKNTATNSGEDNNSANQLSEPPADYKKEQVNWLILQGINTMGEDLAKIKEKMGI